MVIKNTKKDTFMSIPNAKKYKIAEKLGKLYINNNLQNSREQQAVMFDIDDTLLYIKNNSKKNENTVVSLIKPIKNLLDYCIKHDLLVIIITARDNEYKEYTIKELNKYFINYSSLFLHEGFEGETNSDFNTFKSKIKQYLFQRYKIKIIMSVGDNYIDIVGNYSGYGIKLPNKNDPMLYEVYPNSSTLTPVC